MAEKLRNVVIGAAASAVLGAAATAAQPDAWNMVKAFGRVTLEKLQQFASHLGAPSQWPNWITYGCALLAALLALWAGLNLVARARSTLSWRSFTNGQYLGVDWEWGYSSTGSVIKLVPLCPVCHLVLSYEVESNLMRSWDTPPRVRLRCDDCKGSFAQRDGTVEQLEHLVTRHIVRDLRARGNGNGS